MNKILDLRFVIGSFFTIIGLILLIYGLTNGNPQVKAIDRWCGITFTIFGIAMIILSFVKDADDEILSE